MNAFGDATANATADSKTPGPLGCARCGQLIDAPEYNRLVRFDQFTMTLAHANLKLDNPRNAAVRLSSNDPNDWRWVLMARRLVSVFPER